MFERDFQVNQEQHADFRRSAEAYRRQQALLGDTSNAPRPSLYRRALGWFERRFAGRPVEAPCAETPVAAGKPHIEAV